MGKSVPTLVSVSTLAAAAALLATLVLTTALIPLTFLLFFPAVIASAWFGGMRAGLITTLVSALLINYFLFDPPLTFGLRNFGDNLRLGVFVGVAVLISALTTAGQRASRALQELEAERRFRALLEAAPDCIVVTDRDGIITLVNSQTERLFGYQRDALLGQPVEILLPAELREAHRNHRAVFAAAPRTREMGSGLELVAVRRDGSRLPVEVSLSPLETEHGLQVIATLRDVSERRLVQERLRQQQAQLAEAQLIAGVGSWEWDIQADTVVWSDALYRIYGFTHDRPAMSYLGFLELVHPEDRALVDGVVRRAFEEGTAFQFEHRIVRPDGAVRVLYARGEVIRNAAGRVVRMVGTGQDITERRQAEADRERLAREAAARAAAEENQRRLLFLSEVSAILSSSLEYERTLQQVADAAVPFLADWCAVHLLTDEGRVQPLTVAHRDPAKVELVRILQHRYPVELDRPVGVALALRTGQTQFYPEITAAALEAAGYAPEHVRALRAIGVRSAIIVPMTARGRTLGTISLLRADPGPLYDRDDVLLAETLARRAALAVDNARLYQAEQAARRAAELAAARTARLQAVTAALAQALTAEQVAAAVIAHGGAPMGAVAGSLALVTEGGDEVEVTHMGGYDPQVMERAVERYGLRFPLADASPLTDPIRTGRAIFIGSRAEMTARYPQLAAGAAASPYDAWAILPLQLEEHVLGALALNFVGARAFSDDDQSFMLTLAQQCAQALERARLYQAEHAARRAAEEAVEVTAQLQAVTEALATASHTFSAQVPDFQGLLTTIARTISEATGEVCTVRLLTEDGTGLLPSAAWYHDAAVLDATRRLMAATPQPIAGLWQRVIHQRKLAVYTIEADEPPPWAAPELAEYLRTYRPYAIMAAPLEARGRLLGGITLTRLETGRPFSEAEQSLLRDLAARAALAIDNARLYREAEIQRRRLYAVLERLPVAVSIAEAPNGAFSFQNTASRRLAAVLCGPNAGHESLEDSYRDIRYLHPDGAPLSYEDLPAVRAFRMGETADAVEIICDGPAQRRTLLVSAVPLVDTDGNVTASLVVSQDITERKTLEQQKDEFLSLAAHELKTPLTVVKGNSQLLQRLVARDRSSPEQLQQHLERIEQRVRYMEDLINELLDLSRVETGRLEFHPEPMDLADLLRSTVAQQQELHPEVTYRLAHADAPVVGVWDRGRIEQVLTNLLDNAAKYSRPGSPIDVQIEARAGEVEVIVADRGIGIPASDLPHIFDRHYRAHNVDRGHAGLGLGLYLTRQIVQRHGGRIWAESTEGAGATFHIVLPLPAEAPAAAS